MSLKLATLIAMILLAAGTLLQIGVQLLNVWSQELYFLTVLLVNGGFLFFLGVLFFKQRS